MNLTAFNDSFSVSAISGKLVGNLIVENFKLKNALIRSIYRIGGLVGFSYNSNIKILSVHIFNNSFYAKDSYVSLIVTQLIQSAVMANDLFITQNNISSQNMVGGFVAMGSQSKINVVNVILDNFLHANGMAGGFMGLGDSTNYTIQQLKLQGIICVEQWNAGSICGVAYGGQIQINNSIILNNNVTAMLKAGAIVCYCSLSKYIIHNLTINQCYFNSTGFTGAISQADDSQYIVTKFNMLNTIIVGQRYVGGFVAQSTESKYSINNLLIQSSQIQSETEYAGGFCGSFDISSCSINDSIIENTEISADRYSGGFIGCQFNSSQVVSNLSLSELSISANNIAGGFSGESRFTNITADKLSITLSSIKSSNHVVGGVVGEGVYLHLIMQNSSIILVQINGLKYYGLIIGIDERDNVFQISSSTSSKYQINNILQEDCPSLTNNYSVNQCS
ncbi:Por_secretion system C-terminal sorting domain-containing protein [Hexamita inflata]|uniref:Por_secretion system C-terminal sorting domain-containing protein n=2 Tax=Hexamita inflata TaxID=28002 RepID=A0ABP1GKX1_9EUKA